MELADQFGGHSQAVIGTSPRLLGWLPRDVPRQEAEDLPALLVHAPESRRAGQAGPFQRLQQPAHETRIPSGPPANRVTDPDHGAPVHPASQHTGGDATDGAGTVSVSDPPAAPPSPP